MDAEPIVTGGSSETEGARSSARGTVLAGVWARTLRGWSWPGILAELALILLWALWLGRAYLDFHPDTWPLGSDFALTLEPYYAWNYLRECGACVFWNGLINGGYPTFVETHGAILHPLVVLTTLVWGVVSGAKLTAVLSLFLGGVAQWWLARVLKLGVVARLWVAGIAVAGGHMAGRMELGLSAMLLSTASAALVLAPAVDLALTGRRRSAILLGLTFALALLAGQGYVQLGLLLVVTPAALILIFGQGTRPRDLAREFGVAALVAVLVAAVFLVPLLHFWPNLGKQVATAYAGGQPLEYVPLNWVIRDRAFFGNESLGKITLPALFINYIGWVPVAFGMIGLMHPPQNQRRVAWFFGVTIFGLLFLGSGTLLHLLARVAPDTAASYRYPSLVASFTVPLLLGLAGWGVEWFQHLAWPKLSLMLSTGRSFSLRLSWLVVPVILVGSLSVVYRFSEGWLHTLILPPDLRGVAQAAESSSAQWVTPPVGHGWVPYMLEEGRKVTRIFRPWFWARREQPLPHIEAYRDPVSPDQPGFMVTVGATGLVRHAENEYAAISSASGQIPCSATSRGGFIDVHCDADQPGTLVVQENSWTGWVARRDGERIPLADAAWLQVEAPAGAHDYSFRYRPWDAPLGILLSVAGLVLAAWLWVQARQRPSPTTART